MHSLGALSLGGGYNLNHLLDPGGETTTIDLVRAECGLAQRRVHDGVLLFHQRRGNVLVARIEGDVPQVVLNRDRIDPTGR